MIVLIIIAAIVFICNCIIIYKYNQTEPLSNYKGRRRIFEIGFYVLLLIVGVFMLAGTYGLYYLHKKANK